jgi:hypothetical protein
MLSLTDTDEVVKVMAEAGFTIPAIHEAAIRAADTSHTSRIENPPFKPPREGRYHFAIPKRNKPIVGVNKIVEATDVSNFFLSTRKPIRPGKKCANAVLYHPISESPVRTNNYCALDHLPVRLRILAYRYSVAGRPSLIDWQAHTP